jgi:hypothetical protein
MKRPPYSGLKKGAPNPVVLGRKFCSACGRWRPVHDFSRDVRGPRERNGAQATGRKPTAPGLQARCRGCDNRARREQRKNWTPLQREAELEYHRFYSEMRRRRRGQPPRKFRHRRSVIDRVELRLLPRAPIVELLAELNGELGTVGQRARVPSRTLSRLLHDGGRWIRIDTADRLALALGTTLWDLYGDEPLRSPGGRRALV